MSRFIWSHLRRRPGRSVALLLGILVATTGFIVLTGTTETAHLRVTGALDANARAAYDILVRPKGARSALETDRDLVRPNHASGLFGGISRAQLEQVRQVPGVELAAPVAMVGYTMVTLPVPFDITDAVDPAAQQQVIRLDPTLVADRGLTRWDDQPTYVYVTRNPVIVDGPTGPEAPATCGTGMESGRPYEVLPAGGKVRVCNTGQAPPGAGGSNPNGLIAEQRTSLLVYQLTADGYRAALPDRLAEPKERLVVKLPVTVPVLLAAIDPDAEARLTGLGQAVTAGRYLTAADQPTDRVLPILATAKPYLDQQVAVRYFRMGGTDVAGVQPQDLRERLEARPATPVGARQQDLADVYQWTIEWALEAGQGNPPDGIDQVALMIRAGEPTYTVRADGALGVSPRHPDLKAYASGDHAGFSVPGLALDTGFRPLTRRAQRPSDSDNPWRMLSPVGRYDPKKLAGFSELSRVPLGTYQAPTATGADAESRRRLDDQPLLPSGNPAGYLATPPFLLMDLAHYPVLTEPADPISVIRVRVDGTDRYDEITAERVRRTAEQIALATGLDVDITFGSSPAEQTVALPAGEFGRPDLRLTELWSRKGVASVIEQATDRKSVLLSVLVLVVCALFLGNAVAAGVRDRRRELAVLTCLGWPARRIAAAILGEIALLGLVGGALSLLLAVPLGAALGVRVALGQAALAVPVGLLLAMVAGLVPAARAAKAHPAPALRPAVLPARRARWRRTLASLAIANLTRVPGRTLLGAVSLAVGVCALTLLVAVRWAFRGDVQGTLLGDAVTLTVRDVDVVAAVATVLLGLVGVADVLYLNIRDRAAEFATLRATGWTEPTLSRLVTYEGFGLGMIGVIVGATAGLGAVAWFVGVLRPTMVWAAAGTATAGLLVAALAALVPALWLRRLPTTTLLAEE